MAKHDDFYATQSRHARRCFREAMFAAAVWVATLVYCGVVMYRWGYVPVDQRTDNPSLIFGFPSWVFVGLVLPWLVLIGVVWYFAAFILKDDEPYQEFPPDGDRSKGSG